MNLHLLTTRFFVIVYGLLLFASPVCAQVESVTGHTPFGETDVVNSCPLIRPAALEQEADKDSDKVHGPLLPPAPANGNEEPETPPFDSFDDEEPLPPLQQELWEHGGSYLYAPEGDRLNMPPENSDIHYDVLRLPEWWRKPLPGTLFAEFVGV